MDSTLLSPSCIRPFSTTLMSTATMAIPSTLPSLTIRLDRSNYKLWRSQIVPAVRAHELEGFLLGTKPQPEKLIFDSENSAIGILNSEHTLLIRLDRFLMCWLLCSILEHMLGHVIHCQTAAEVWKTLDQIFSSKSKARILQLRLSLQTIKKGLGSIED